MKIRHILWFPLSALIVAQPAGADIDSGMHLHEAHCSACHDSSVYTRENRRVKNIDALINQVWRCEQGLGLKLFDDEVQDLVDYLDQRYYRFKASGGKAP